MARHLDNLETENSLMKTRLISTLQPVLLSMILGSADQISQLFFMEWRTVTEANRIGRLRENHDLELRKVKAELQAQVKEIEKVLRGEQQKQEALAAQLNHVNERISQSAEELASTRMRGDRIQEQLNIAEETIQAHAQTAESLYDGVRSHLTGYTTRTKSLQENGSLAMVVPQAKKGGSRGQAADLLDNEARWELDDIQAKLALIFNKVQSQTATRQMGDQSSATAPSSVSSPVNVRNGQITME